jgi:hypothetical protein
MEMSSDQVQQKVSPLVELASQLRAQAALLRAEDPAAAAQLDVKAEKLEQGAIDNAINAEGEWHKTRYQKWLDEWRHNHEWYLENDRSTIAFSQAAQRNLILINAGAAVALLAFMGNLLTKGLSVTSFVPAMAWFAAGVALGTLTSALAYVTQLLYGSKDENGSRDEKRVKLGEICHRASIAMGLATLAVFVGGCMVTCSAFDSQNQKPATKPLDVPDRRNAPPPRQPSQTPPAPPLPMTPSKPATPIKP